MFQARKLRLGYLGGLMVITAVSIYLLLIALKQNLQLYVTPSQVAQMGEHHTKFFRLEGWVEPGSVVWKQGSSELVFALRDEYTKIYVSYNGILPALFQEGNGAVVQGKLIHPGLFQATEVLAKHNENYQPPIGITQG